MTEVDPEAVNRLILSEVGRVIVGNETIVERILVSLLTGGHVLLEGVPGTAKTSIANTFARVTGLNHSRIQMTPDLLPADITGTKVYYERRSEFELQRGPVFGNLVVADEINRATPKTQSALLEAMQERQVTIGEETHPLPEPFILVATQNPIEMQGVFDLPEAQRDRFQFKLPVNIPEREDERQVLDRFDDAPNLDPEHLDQVVTREEILAIREHIGSVYVDEKIKECILQIVAGTRENEATSHGASTRAAVSFMDACKAHAAIRGRDYVIPDDVEELAADAFAHRLVLSTDADLRKQSSRDIVRDVILDIDVPRNGAVDSPEVTD
jgi:MoxR-like ATPase